MNDLSPNIVLVIKLLLAMVCGGAIGLERELSHKPAGLRTNVLIAMAACLLMIACARQGGAPYTDRSPGPQVIGARLYRGACLAVARLCQGLKTAATISSSQQSASSIDEGGSARRCSRRCSYLRVVLLRRVEQFPAPRRLFHYSFKTTDPARFTKARTARKERVSMEIR